MDGYIAIVLIPVYILLALLGRRLLTYSHGYEKGLEDAEKIRKMKEKAYRKTESIPFLMHKKLNVPISECQKAYDVAINYLKSQSKMKG